VPPSEKLQSEGCMHSIEPLRLHPFKSLRSPFGTRFRTPSPCRLQTKWPASAALPGSRCCATQRNDAVVRTLASFACATIRGPLPGTRADSSAWARQGANGSGTRLASRFPFVSQASPELLAPRLSRWLFGLGQSSDSPVAPAASPASEPSGSTDSNTDSMAASA